MKCSICNKEIEKGHGNNADPFRFHKACCDTCNDNLIVPIRMFLAGMYPGVAMKLMCDGQISTFRPGEADTNHRRSKYFSLDEMQSIVDGYIEFLPSKYLVNSLADRFYFIVDEEGKLKGKKPNQLAYELFNINVVGTLLIMPKDLLDHEE